MVVKKFGWDMPEVRRPEHDMRSFVDKPSEFLHLLEHGVFDKAGKARKARGTLVCEDRVPVLTVPIHEARMVYAIYLGDNDFAAGFMNKVKKYVVVLCSPYNHNPLDKNFGVDK